jgi:carbonic anhydrase/acetyltransferase-like protein (isoleucine patch superfamily)
VTVRAVGDKVPRIAPTAWVSEAAYVVGDVELGEGSSVWPGSVVRADVAPIRIGVGTHIEDNCVVHTGIPLTVGDNVLVGHGVVLHCRSVGDHCLIGNRAILLDGAEIGDHVLVAAGAVVLGGTVVPPRSFVVGSPATVRPARPDHLALLDGLGKVEGGYHELMRTYRDAGL